MLFIISFIIRVTHLHAVANSIENIILKKETETSLLSFLHFFKELLAYYLRSMCNAWVDFVSEVDDVL